MAEKNITFNLDQLLEEIRKSDGLPENISTEAQLWDEILKKQAYLMSDQLFPLIKEIHGKYYSPGTPVEPLATEYSVERAKTKEISSIRADITLVVNGKDIYHFECQIKNDGTMVLRMFEYDGHLALSYPSTMDDELVLRFPHSAVLYLQDNGSTPDQLHCQIQFQDGSTYEYTIPTLKVQSYSLEEIHEKHLCVLIPFLPLRFRKRMMRNREDGTIRFQLEKEELTSFYQQLILILDTEVADGYLTENNRSAILSLLNKSMIRVFYRDEKLLKEVIDLTQPILELEIDKYIQELEQTSQELEQTSQELEQYKKKELEDKELIASLQAQLAVLQKQTVPAQSDR